MKNSNNKSLLPLSTILKRIDTREWNLENGARPPYPWYFTELKENAILSWAQRNGIDEIRARRIMILLRTPNHRL